MTVAQEREKVQATIENSVHVFLNVPADISRE